MVEVSVSELEHVFDRRMVFGGVNFTFADSCLAVTGPNGSGKSTLLRIMAGLLTPTSGSVDIRVDGARLDREQLRNAVGLASPDVSLYEELSPRENLRFLRRARGLGKGDSRICGLLDELGIADRADDRCGDLSSGLRQRVCLAAALVHDPLLLLLDEPSANLDEAGRELIRAIIDRQAEYGAAILATNDMGEADLGAARIDLGAM